MSSSFGFTDWDKLTQYFEGQIDGLRIYNSVSDIRFRRDSTTVISLSEFNKYYNNLNIIKFCPKCMNTELEKYFGVNNKILEPFVTCRDCNHRFIIHLK